MRTAESLLPTSSTTLVFEDIFSRIFEMVANVIDKQKPLIDTHFGPGKILRLIQRLQRESDVQSCIMIDTLLDKKQVQRMLNEIRDKTEGVDARSVDLILSEIALISAKTHLFEMFIGKRAKSEMDVLVDESFKEKTLSLYKHNASGLPLTSKILSRIEAVLLHYVKLEDYFVKTSIEKVHCLWFIG
jgi:conserved oligomeric Golgi complex subunit 4